MAVFYQKLSINNGNITPINVPEEVFEDCYDDNDLGSKQWDEIPADIQNELKSVANSISSVNRLCIIKESVPLLNPQTTYEVHICPRDVEAFRDPGFARANWDDGVI